jgi:hypothetical protein
MTASWSRIPESAKQRGTNWQMMPSTVLRQGKQRAQAAWTPISTRCLLLWEKATNGDDYLLEAISPWTRNYNRITLFQNCPLDLSRLPAVLLGRPLLVSHRDQQVWTVVYKRHQACHHGQGVRRYQRLGMRKPPSAVNLGLCSQPRNHLAAKLLSEPRHCSQHSQLHHPRGGNRHLFFPVHHHQMPLPKMFRHRSPLLHEPFGVAVELARGYRATRLAEWQPRCEVGSLRWDQNVRPSLKGLPRQ